MTGFGFIASQKKKKKSTTALHLIICVCPQALSWKWLFGATAVAIGSVALSVVIAARNWTEPVMTTRPSNWKRRGTHGGASQRLDKESACAVPSVASSPSFHCLSHCVAALLENRQVINHRQRFGNGISELINVQVAACLWQRPRWFPFAAIFFFLSLSRSKCSEIDDYRIKIVMIAIDNKDIPLFPVWKSKLMWYGPIWCCRFGFGFFFAHDDLCNYTLI